VLTYRDIRLTRRQEATAQLVRKAVEDLVSVLTERLETKENVTLVRIDVARVRTEVATLREVIRELNRTVEQQQRKRAGQ
jgi:nickel-dependent lactate racemase